MSTMFLALYLFSSFEISVVLTCFGSSAVLWRCTRELSDDSGMLTSILVWCSM